MKYHVTLMAMLVGLVLFSSAAARTWTSANGKYTIEADLVGLENGKVLLRKSTGEQISVPLEKLSTTDQQYVRRRATAPASSPKSSGNQRSDVAEPAGACTCQLSLKRHEPPSRSGNSRSGSTWDSYDRLTIPQRFSIQYSAEKKGKVQSAQMETQAAAFQRIVKKKPPLRSEHPLVGVARLGSGEYAFAVDAAPDKPAAKASTSSAKSGAKGRALPRYNRLLFDANHNGDLTDDPVIEAEPQKGTPSSDSDSTRNRFPPVNLDVDVDGTKAPYAFCFTVSAGKSGSVVSVSAALTPAIHREGEMTLDGKQLHFVLLDHNSNGRFNDAFAVPEGAARSQESIYPVQGDVLLVEPGGNRSDDRSGSDPMSGDNQHYVSRLIWVGDRFYNVEIPPAGDSLTLTPCSLPVGRVTSPDAGFRAVMYGDLGILQIAGGESNPAPLPAGNWRLLSYMIRRVESQPPKEPRAEGGKSTKVSTKRPAEPRSALADSSSKADSAGRFSSVSAQGTGACPVVAVREGEVISLPFGPPYKPVVKATELRAGQEAPLQMRLLGSGGEVCTSLLVHGKLPEKPSFTIRSPEGEVVERGKLEFG